MKATPIIFLLAIFQLLSIPSFGHVTLVTPKEDSVYAAGDLITIEWQIDIEHQQLNWDLLFSVDQGLTWEAIALDLPTTQFSFEWMFPGKTYEKFRIQVIQDNTGVDYHDTNQFDIGPPNIVTVLNNLRFQKPLLSLSSNPVGASSRVIFNTEYRALARISVYDQRGNLVLQVFNGVLHPGKNEFPLIPQEGPIHFKRGIYFLKVQSQKFTETVRFIYLN